VTYTEAKLLHAICESPEEPTYRAVYIDWLGENGRFDEGEALMAMKDQACVDVQFNHYREERAFPSFTQADDGPWRDTPVIDNLTRTFRYTLFKKHGFVELIKIEPQFLHMIGSAYCFQPTDVRFEGRPIETHISQKHFRPLLQDEMFTVAAADKRLSKLNMIFSVDRVIKRIDVLYSNPGELNYLVEKRWREAEITLQNGIGRLYLRRLRIERLNKLSKEQGGGETWE